MKKYIIYFVLFIVIAGFITVVRGYASGSGLFTPSYWELGDTHELSSDSVDIKYPVKKTTGKNYKEINKTGTVDFKTPSNVTTSIEYDPNTFSYYFVTKVGDIEIATPFSMNSDEYLQHSQDRMMRDYFKRKNSGNIKVNGVGDDDFTLKNIKINVSPIDKIFGEGGVKVKATGYVEATMGIKRTTDNNPMLSANKRTRTMFDFDENIQLNMNATVGDRINFDMNYDTEAMFDFDTKKIRLAYDASMAGDEDGILRKIEAGNVTMATTNSLIRGGTALFGITSELQFGKLKINTIISQQESESYSASTSGGSQKNLFDFRADNYDENRHFYLTEYFRDTYDRAMSRLPLILSEVSITKMEVWVTNSRTNTDQARDIVAFADLGESKNIHNKDKWTSNTSQAQPYNDANNLYSTMVGITGLRDINKVTQLLEGQELESGQDYEKVESARLLSESEYFYNSKLGYISLMSALQPSEVLAVSFTYLMNGTTYRVGDLTSEVVSPYNEANPQRSGALFVKLLKPTSLSPESYSWNMMMKNVYNLGATNIQKEDFVLHVKYKADSLGVTINYFPEGKMKDKLFIRVMGLDKLNRNEQKRPDGVFDFLEGYTIRSATGRVYFPHVEPFGKGLRDSIADNTIADKYVFQELYDRTKTEAQQNGEQNKYFLSGSYKGSGAKNEINLNAFNIPVGSVTVSAAGVLLIENVDYIIDYAGGKVLIINQELIDAQTAVNVSFEGQSYSTQRKTLMGVNLSYEFNKDFNIGGTLMRYSERPLISNLGYGQDAVQNTLFGFNTSYRKQSMWLTNLINQVPFINASAPSSFNVNAEFAKMLPRHYVNKNTGAYSYLDDFETARTGFDIKNPYAWSLASTPTGTFAEGKLSNDISYGFNRAMMAWFSIDPIFTRRNSSLTPEHIKYDLDQLSNHFVREILLEEIYPQKDIPYNMSSVIYPLNISYYPEERGPYNLDTQSMSANGKLLSPKTRWGGMMRKLDVTDFEATNIEYIEFWLMDPFANDNGTSATNKDGKLVFNLGSISEDILKDGRKFYENGLPLDRNWNDVDTTVWGKVPKKQSLVYAFNNQDENAIRIQDVGLNGLSIEEEFEYKTYSKYLDELRTKLSPTVIQQMMEDQFSPFKTPAKDKYHYYRGSDYDREQLGILERYKYYNNTEGNSLPERDTNENYSTAARSTPDVEDINQDFTMNETEAYYEYVVNLDPQKMEIGSNYIVDKRELAVNLRNNTTGQIKWYQFRIPLKGDKRSVGNISNFNSIRFIRMFLTGFDREMFLRFATLELVKGDWRTYNQPLNAQNILGTGVIDISTVNIEENSDRQPVNYVLPPGVNRIQDPNQKQITQENEQSLLIKVTNLEPKDSKAIYKGTIYDLRPFKRIQMFSHLENMRGSNSLVDGDFSIFMRLGSDYKENYYEYEIPLSVTPPGYYNNNNTNDKFIVWPENNMFNFPLALLTNVKLSRNKAMKLNSSVSYVTQYFEYDPEKPMNRVTVMGNPSLSDVDVIMIGVRNNSRENQSGIVWVDELRLTDFDEEGGWAMQGSANLALSDIAQVSFSGRKETVGFGTIEQSLLERRKTDLEMYTISTSIDMGRLLPEQAKLVMPFSFSYSKETITPKYDPFDKDITLKESLSLLQNKAEKDSLNSLARERMMTRSFSFNNVRLNHFSSNPMPYDPANFSFSYVQNFSETNTPGIVYDQTLYYQVNMNYSYSPATKTWEPFKKLESKKGWAKYLKSLGINFWPNTIALNSTITRNYTETMTRDIEGYRLGVHNDNNSLLSWSQSFFWNRDFNMNWNLTKNLKMSFQSGTKAEIEEPYLQVNKKANRSGYEEWKDEVWRSIKNLGTPYSYHQSFNLSYQLPFNMIPALDWIQSSTLSYKSDYSWDRGAQVDTLEVGNIIQNNKTFELNSRLSLVNLYNKSSYLKSVNDRFDGKKPRAAAGNQNARRAVPPKRPFKQTVVLKKDTGIVVMHNLGTKDIDVKAGQGEKEFKLKYKKINDNSIYISNKDSISLSLTIAPKEQKDKNKFIEEFKAYSARALMSVRTLNLTYSKRNETFLPGFRPRVGDVFGQNSSDFGYVPGVGFAFGVDGGEDFINKSLNREWLVLNSVNINPAIYNRSEKLNIQAAVEPIRGLAIQLKAGREQTQRTEFQYMFDGMPQIFGGSFSMTTIAIGSSFQIGKAENNYYSEAFQQFLNNRSVIAGRLGKEYGSVRYPSNGFMSNFPGLINKPYDANVSPVDLASSDVLIPAFLAAYTGRDAKKVSLSPFPNLLSVLPNWTVVYDLLTNVSALKTHFKSIQLTHGYQSFYQVTGYNSFSNWVGASGNYGFKPDFLTGNPIPGSPFDISSVTITESFNPLFGINTTLNNGILLNILYRRDRTLNLNISSYQIVESLTRDVVFGGGYRINQFNKLIGLKMNNKDNTFNNDLTLKLDVSSKMNQYLIRKIEDNYTQATNGNTTFMFMFSVDYSLSKAMSLRAFYDWVVNKPLISATTYPITNTNFGISIKYNLTQ